MTKQPILLDSIDSYNKPCVLAIGMFDALHIGHQKVIQKAKEIAKAQKAIVGILTFSPHPSTVIDMKREPAKMIYGNHLRTETFANEGVEEIFEKRFDLEFAGLSCDEFENFLKQKFPNLKGIVTGTNFVFAKNATGNVETLTKMAKENGWQYQAVDGVMFDEKKRISSSLIRDAISTGNIDLFKQVTGRHYTCSGNVQSGKKLGRTIGFPTLNLPWVSECKVAFGVYIVNLSHNGKIYKGIANYGVNPTLENRTPILETHLFENVDFGEGEFITVELLKFIRPEKKFESLDALIKQISKDKEIALNLAKNL